SAYNCGARGRSGTWTAASNAVRHALDERVFTSAGPGRKSCRLFLCALSAPCDQQPLGNGRASFDSALAFGASLSGLGRASFIAAFGASSSLRATLAAHSDPDVIAIRPVGSFARAQLWTICAGLG